MKPLFYIYIVAAIIHLLFWLNLIPYPTVRQRSMQWLYTYLAIDVLLLIRVFIIYAYQSRPMCVPHFLRTIMCYYEAIFDNYLNVLQSYIILALNICRYLQITDNRDIYVIRHRTIIISHFLIYILPILCYIIAILCHWLVIFKPQNDICDLELTSAVVQILFLLFSYFIPLVFTSIFLFLSLRHIRNTNGIRTQQIIEARLKYHRQLIIQSGAFYSVWLILWSPYLLLFPFYYRHSTSGTITEIFICIGIVLDPFIVAALDIRFLRAWHSTWNHLIECIRPVRVAPMPVAIAPNY
ncbi:unnamed protein product [Adineta steineri]|uniref:G-protein coupled receptors family 1 profile domain-containing protein n=1 Tax=Adineta steineri TaxID=433720 RepID=A0A815ZQ52_9BILA|nr:unnamed protein product [Adineta steineri]CAF1585132.1 unnamed protein product [Adineta steineri]